MISLKIPNLACFCGFLFFPVWFFANSILAKPAAEPEFGVLRAWQASEGQGYHVAGPEDVIVVEVKDFSGWLIRQVEIRGYFADKAIDSASSDLKRIIQNHAFEAGNAAAAALENAMEGDVNTLSVILGKKDLATYTKALLTNEKKWVEDENEQKRLLRGRRSPEKVIGPLLATTVFTDLSDLLPQDAEKNTDISKTSKLLQDIKLCSEQLIRAGRDTLRLKINDIIFEDAGALNSNSAAVDGYRRPKANPLSDYEWFRFRLVEDTKSAGGWSELRRSGLYKHDVGLTLVTTIGGRIVPLPTTVQPPTLDSGAPQAPDADRFFLQIASPGWTAGAVAIFLLVVSVLIVLGLRTDLISDTSGTRRPDGIRPYSLARGQMAFWFLIIIWASLFLWLATGSWHILNDTCLWLIGIGSGTALGSAIISETDPAKSAVSKRNPLTRRRSENLVDFTTRLDAAVKDANTTVAGAQSQELAAVTERRDWLVKQKEDLTRLPQIRWRRLMQDWLTDDDVYSFHRYQMLAWTLVLGLFFIAKVWSRWELPTFDGTTLALLGITSGTYLGFKLQKSQ